MEQDETLKRIAELRAQGKKYRQIAVELGLPLSRVYRLATKASPQDAPPQPPSPTDALLASLRARGEAPAAPPPATEADTRRMLEGELARLKEAVDRGMPLTPLEMRRCVDVALRLKGLAVAPAASTIDTSKASVSEIRLLRVLFAVRDELAGRECAPEPDPLIDLAVRLLEVSSVRPRAFAAPPAAVERMRELAQAVLSGRLPARPAPPAPKTERAAPPVEHEPAAPEPPTGDGRQWHPLGSLSPFRDVK